MDPIKAQKLRAMNLYKKSDTFLQSLILHSLIALFCSLFCSYSYSFPSSFYIIKHLLFHSLPNTWAWFLNPTSLFVVANFIVVFLIGESRLSGKRSSSPANEIYDEYVARARSMRKRHPSTVLQEIKKEESIAVAMTDPKKGNENQIEDHKEFDEEVVKEEMVDQDEDFKECEETVIEKENYEEDNEEGEEKAEEEEQKYEHEQEEEEAIGMPAEELNKRVEDFIARVNKQRWLEARF